MPSSFTHDARSIYRCFYKLPLPGTHPQHILWLAYSYLSLRYQFQFHFSEKAVSEHYSLDEVPPYPFCHPPHVCPYPHFSLYSPQTLWSVIICSFFALTTSFIPHAYHCSLLEHQPGLGQLFQPGTEQWKAEGKKHIAPPHSIALNVWPWASGFPGCSLSLVHLLSVLLANPIVLLVPPDIFHHSSLSTYFTSYFT